MSMEKVEIGSSAVILTGLAGALAKLSVLSGAGAGLSATIPDNSETGATLRAVWGAAVSALGGCTAKGARETGPCPVSGRITTNPRHRAATEVVAASTGRLLKA